MYYSLQIGRAVAALLVVLLHLGSSIADEKYFGIKSFDIPFSFGSAGVQFFFVLSGFIIFSVHKNDLSQPKKILTYIKKRIIRIYPVFIVIFTVVYLAAFFTPLKDILPLDFVNIVSALLLLPHEQGFPVLTVAWTLTYEILFYFAFVLLILNKNLIYFLGLTLVYFNFFYNSDDSTPLIKMLQNDNIFLFIFGMLIAYFNNINVNNKISLSIFYLGILLFLGLALDTIMKYNIIDNKVLCYGLASSLIVFGITNLERHGWNFKQYTKLVLLGNASYALYLIHYPIISLLTKLSVKIGIVDWGLLGASFTYFITFIICLVAAIIFHLYIEKPMLKYLHNKFIQVKGL